MGKLCLNNVVGYSEGEKGKHIVKYFIDYFKQKDSREYFFYDIYIKLELFNLWVDIFISSLLPDCLTKFKLSKL